MITNFHSDVPNNKQYRIIDLIMYVIDFFFHRKKFNEDRKKEKDECRKRKIADHLQKEYDKIDKTVADDKFTQDDDDKRIQDNLDNMF